MTTEEQTSRLVSRLLAGEGESECIEFKHNNDKPDRIGEYISGLANSAALHGQLKAYVLWGIDDASKHVVGTTIDP